MTEENTWYEQYTLWAMRDLSENVYIAIQPAVPDYEEWGADGHKVRVDGRAWIKVK